MTNNKVEATFHPGNVDLQARMSNLHPAIRQMQRILESPDFRIRIRKVERAFYNLRWALRNGSLSDDERYAIRLMKMHREEGRMDLVEEDFLWLGRRLERKA